MNGQLSIASEELIEIHVLKWRAEHIEEAAPRQSSPETQIAVGQKEEKIRPPAGAQRSDRFPGQAIGVLCRDDHTPWSDGIRIAFLRMGRQLDEASGPDWHGQQRRYRR